MTRCKYYDCGYCYAPKDIKSNDVKGACIEPEYCPYLISQKINNHKSPMTELEELKAQLKILEKKVALLEEIEKTPIPKMELLKEGSVYCVEYNNKNYYRMKYRHSDEWIKWWREDHEEGGGYYLDRVDDAETFRLLEQLFAADISANPQGSLKFTFGPSLYYVIEEWWSDVFTSGSDEDAETSIRGLVEKIWEWMPSYQSASGSQSVGVEELVAGWNDCLDTIRRKLG